MILTGFIQVAFFLVNLFFVLLPDLPKLPVSITNGLNGGLNALMNNGLSIVSLFIDVEVFRACCAIALALAVAEPVYYIVIWILKKIPLLNIQ